MVVIVKKKNGQRIKGIKCGHEGGMLYLVNPWEQIEPGPDDKHFGEVDFWESPLGGEIDCGSDRARFVLIPVSDIGTIESCRL